MSSCVAFSATVIYIARCFPESVYYMSRFLILEEAAVGWLLIRLFDLYVRTVIHE